MWTVESPWNPPKQRLSSGSKVKIKSFISTVGLFSEESFSAASTIIQLASRRKKLLNLENGSVSRVPGPHWSSAPSLHGTDSNFRSFQRHLRSVFQCLSSTPEKRKQLFISHLSSHISLARRAAARPSHGMHSLWNANQPFQNCVPPPDRWKHW